MSNIPYSERKKERKPSSLIPALLALLFFCMLFRLHSCDQQERTISIRESYEKGFRDGRRSLKGNIPEIQHKEDD